MKLLRTENKIFNINDYDYLRFIVIEKSIIQLKGKKGKKHKVLTNVSIDSIREFAKKNNIDLSFLADEKTINLYMNFLCTRLIDTVNSFINGEEMPIDTDNKNNKILNLDSYLRMSILSIGEKEIKEFNNNLDEYKNKYTFKPNVKGKSIIINNISYNINQFKELEFTFKEDFIYFRVLNKANKWDSLFGLDFNKLKNIKGLDLSFIKTNKNKNEFLMFVCYMMNDLLKDFTSDLLDTNVLNLEEHLFYLIQDITDCKKNN